jgi:transposase-like protein
MYTTVDYCPMCGSDEIQVIDCNSQGIRHYCWSCNYDWYEYDEEGKDY